MSLIKFTRFGGLMPRALADALPGDAAQIATDLNASSADFRPVGADTQIVAGIGTNNPQTIYRLQRTAGGTLNTDFTSAATWKVYSGKMSLAKYPINDDTTDRHVLTYDDGSAPPRWIDAAGLDRLLGIPSPGTAPTVTLNVVDEFTVEERPVSVEAAKQSVLSAITANVTPVWRGAAHPGVVASGMLDHTTGNGFAGDEPSQKVRLYKLTAAGGSIADAYATPDDSTFSWVFDPALTAHPLTAPSGLSWATAGDNLIGIGYVAYGLTYDLSSSGLNAALTAIPMPGLSDGTTLFTAGQVTAVVSALAAVVAVSGDVKPSLDALASKSLEVEQLLAGGQRASLATTLQAFYSKADVAAEITQMIANAADAIYATAYSIAHSSLPEDYNQGGPGNGA